VAKGKKPAKAHHPFFMLKRGSGYIRVPIHKELGSAYSKAYDRRYNKAYRAARRRRAPTTRPNPGSSIWTLPVLGLAAILAYGYWKQQQTQTPTV